MNEILQVLLYHTITGVVWSYTILTYPVYALLHKPWKTWALMNQPKVKEIESSEGIAFASGRELAPIQETMVKQQLNTLSKVFNYACEKFSDRPCLGTRQVLSESDEQQPDGPLLKKLELGEYEWISFSQASKIALSFGNGLRALNVAPNNKILIFSETRQEYFLAAMGAYDQNFTICTLYATLGEDEIIHGINETEVNVVVCSPDLLPKIQIVLPKCPKVTHIIYFLDPLHDVNTNINCTMYSFSDIIKHGETVAYENSPPTPEDIAIIMYTSGSTGTPKGVMLSHGNITTGMRQMAPAIAPKPGAMYLAFLPLAHVLELLGESVMMLFGTPMGYSSPFTLTDISTKIKKGQKGDATVLRPTVMPSVPLILDRIYKSASETVKAKGPFFEKIFKFFVDYRLYWMRRGWKTPVTNNVIFRKTRALLGGRMRGIGCGGAPLAPNTHDFIRAVLGVNIPLGYGLTETCATGAMMDHWCDFSTGNVGSPPLFGYIKLIDWMEGGYSIKDKPYPRGEIVVGGENVATGYFKNPELTAENFYEMDGQRWFRTGDIGQMETNGTLKIIDRKKDLVKIQTGEYISLGKIETVLKLCPFVDNICICSDIDQNSVVAVVSVSPKAAESLSSRANCEDLNHPRVQQAALEEILRTGKQGKLNKYELPTTCYLTTEAWTPDTDLVTPTMKLKRRNIHERYKEQIKEMFSV